jgi:hypothetical protein
MFGAPMTTLTKTVDPTILAAANAWAIAKGFAHAGAVPTASAGELVAAVAQATTRPSAEVQAALVAVAGAASAAGAASHQKLGLDPSARKASAHVPLGGQAGLRPVGLQLAQAEAAAPSGIGELFAHADVKFEQVAADLEDARLAITGRAKPKTLDEVHRLTSRIMSLFGQLEATPSDKQVQQEIVRLYKDLLAQASRARGVFLVKAPEGGWPTIAAAKRRVDEGRPSVDGGSDALSGASVARDALYDRVDDAARADGLPEISADARRRLGVGATLAVDADTGRAFVLDFHGAVERLHTLEDFLGTHEPEKPDRLDAPIAVAPEQLEALRGMSDAQLAKLRGEITHVTLREDDAGFARSYATKWTKPPHGLMSRRVVVEGPFRGVYLDDLVNLLESSGPRFRFDPKGSGPGLPTTPKEGEPFVTTATVKERGLPREKLYVQVPFNSAYTELRQSLRRLSEIDPNVKYDRDTKNCGFYFEPNQYATVRTIAGGLALSKGATDALERQFADLTRVELAAADKNLGRYTAGAIGGFKKATKAADGSAKPVSLSYWQKKSLAWLEASGWRGVVALDTGMGKTLAGIAMMQRLRRHEGETRPFLAVVPPALRGNFAQEIHKFLEPDEAKALVAQLQVMSYPDFARAVRRGELDASKFGGVIFDEAQWLKNPNTTRARAALAFDHPRKICLTASPMESSPMEAYALACVANNVNLHDKVEGKDHRWRMRKFKELYCVTLGGRILGLKDEVQLRPGVDVDPKHELFTWVRRNVFYADKRVDDTPLPDLALRGTTLPMPAALEEAYRKKSKQIVKVLRGMVSLYRDKGVAREYVDAKGRRRVEIDPLARDKRIGQMFGVRFRGLVGELNELTNRPEKLTRAADLFAKKLEATPSSRAVLFSDSPDYVLASAKQLSTEIPGKLHAACLANEIRFFMDGEEVEEVAGHAAPFKAREYRRDPTQPADPATNRAYGAHEWQKFVLDEVIGRDPDVITTTMLGPVYQQGQNLQWADVGFHLDRDTWNRENTKQREARLWRKGQTKPVEFHNLDWVFKKPIDGLDRTLDEIRGYYELIASDLFREVIERPSREVKLGAEWSPARDREAFSWDFDPFALGLDPTPRHAAGGDAGGAG